MTGAPIRKLNTKFKRAPSRQSRHGLTVFGWLNAGSHNMSGSKSSDSMHPKIGASPAVRLKMQPMSDLDLMIANGWGNTPQYKLPADWRTRKK